MKLALTLPWPDKTLHPNARVHWAKKAKATKAARQQAYLTALEHGWDRARLPDGRLHLWLDFVPPDRRRRDDDGMLAAFKAARDGLADALRVNDSRFVSHPFVNEEPTAGGMVLVTLTDGALE